jgi:hypothetical protein
LPLWCRAPTAVRNWTRCSSSRTCGNMASGGDRRPHGRRCSRRGQLYVIGNPHAEGFYISCGFRVTGTVVTRFGIGLPCGDRCKRPRPSNRYLAPPRKASSRIRALSRAGYMPRSAGRSDEHRELEVDPICTVSESRERSPLTRRHRHPASGHSRLRNIVHPACSFATVKISGDRCQVVARLACELKRPNQVSRSLSVRVVSARKASGIVPGPWLRPHPTVLAQVVPDEAFDGKSRTRSRDAHRLGTAVVTVSFSQVARDLERPPIRGNHAARPRIERRNRSWCGPRLAHDR